MSEVLYDLFDFAGFDAEEGCATSEFEVLQLSGNKLSVESKTTDNSFLKFLLPSLPFGAQVTFTCDVRWVSGDAGYLALDSYTKGDYKTGKTVHGQASTGTNSEFTEIKVSMYVNPGHTYVRAVLGYFSQKVGKMEIRHPRITVKGADLTQAKPWEVTPPNYDRYFSVEELNREWKSVATGNGVVNKQSDKIICTADDASRAYIRYADSDSVADIENFAFRGLDGSKGVSVDIKMTRRTGLCGVWMDYFDGDGARLTTLKGFFFGYPDTWAKFWFPPYEGAVFCSPVIGLTSGTDGDCDIKGVKLAQYGGVRSNQPQSFNLLCAAIRQKAGTWLIENNGESTGYVWSSSIIESLTINATNITVNFKDKSLQGYRPLMIAQVDSFNNRAGTIRAATNDTVENQTTLTFYNAQTGAVINPANIPDDTFINLIGIGTR